MAIILWVSPAAGYSQGNFFDAIEFEKRQDYRAQEELVLEMARYVLSRPMDENDPNRVSAMQNIVKWMTGTPDHQFIIDESMGKLMKKNEDLLGLFMASMTQYVLENRNARPSATDIKLNSFKIMLDYCRNGMNGVKATKELRRAIEAHDNGTLQKYLKM